MSPPDIRPQAGTGPRLRKGEQTAERILDAAENLFASRGYAGTTLRDVAEAVGLRTPSLYNHFESKDALYEAVLERGISPVLKALVEAVDSRQSHDAQALVDTLMAQLADRPKLPQLIQHESLAGGERLSPMLREWIAPIFARADQMIETGPAANRWQPEQFPLLVIAMYNIIVGYFTIAPLYKEVNGRDLLSSKMLEQQTRLFGELIVLIFGSSPTDEPGGQGEIPQPEVRRLGGSESDSKR
ncbi:MAG: TetR/AcrR family transcriptional regulator [Deltaproteobacteria bacterium]|nr:TetR/AcrR family transcriptional regulator [Deltaproteobacteria bacterium]